MPPSAPAESLLYPIGLNLADRPVLLIGAGTVAARKAARLVPTGCRLTVITRDIGQAFASWLNTLPADQRPDIRRMPFEPGHLDTIRPVLVFACTDDPTVNATCVAGAQARNMLTNSATGAAEASDFIVPSVVDSYAPLQIALFSGGTSPTFLRQLREQLTGQLGEWIPVYLSLLAQLRAEIRIRVPHDEARRKALNAQVVADESLPDRLRAGESPEQAFTTLCAELFQ